MTILAVGGNGLIIFIGTANHSILSNVSTLLIFVLCMSHFLQGIGKKLSDFFVNLSRINRRGKYFRDDFKIVSSYYVVPL